MDGRVDLPCAQIVQDKHVGDRTGLRKGPRRIVFAVGPGKNGNEDARVGNRCRCVTRLAREALQWLHHAIRALFRLCRVDRFQRSCPSLFELRKVHAQIPDFQNGLCEGFTQFEDGKARQGIRRRRAGGKLKDQGPRFQAEQAGSGEGCGHAETDPVPERHGGHGTGQTAETDRGCGNRLAVRQCLCNGFIGMLELFQIRQTHIVPGHGHHHDAAACLLEFRRNGLSNVHGRQCEGNERRWHTHVRKVPDMLSFPPMAATPKDICAQNAPRRALSGFPQREGSLPSFSKYS